MNNKTKQEISFEEYKEEVIRQLTYDYGWTHTPDNYFIKSDYDSGKTVIQSVLTFEK